MRRPCSRHSGAASIVAIVALACCGEPPPNSPTPLVACGPAELIVGATVGDTVRIAADLPRGASCRILQRTPSGDALALDLVDVPAPEEGACAVVPIADVTASAAVDVSCVDADRVATFRHVDLWVRSRPLTLVLTHGDDDVFSASWSRQGPLVGCTVGPAAGEIAAELLTGTQTVEVTTAVTTVTLMCAAEGIPGGDASPQVLSAAVYVGALDVDGTAQPDPATLQLVTGILDIARYPVAGDVADKGLTFVALREADRIDALFDRRALTPPRVDFPALSSIHLGGLRSNLPAGVLTLPVLISGSVTSVHNLELPLLTIGTLDVAGPLDFDGLRSSESTILSAPQLVSGSVHAGAGITHIALPRFEAGSIAATQPQVPGVIHREFDIALNPQAEQVRYTLTGLRLSSLSLPSARHTGQQPNFTMVFIGDSTIGELTGDDSDAAPYFVSLSDTDVDVLAIQPEELQIYGGNISHWEGAARRVRIEQTSNLASLDLTMEAGDLLVADAPLLADLSLQSQGTFGTSQLSSVGLEHLNADGVRLGDLTLWNVQSSALAIQAHAINSATVSGGLALERLALAAHTVDALTIQNTQTLQTITATGVVVRDALTLTENAALTCAAIETLLCGLASPRPETLTIAANAEDGCPTPYSSCP